MPQKQPIGCLILRVFVFSTFLFTNCMPSDSGFDPCSRHYELDSLEPAEASTHWIPYFTGQMLQAKSLAIGVIPFRVDSVPILINSERSFFEIPCYEDSLKINRVFYTSLMYQCKLINLSKLLAVREIHISLYVLLDELNSKLDKLKLADILEVDFILSEAGQSNTKRMVIQFPVLDRGFANTFKSNFKFDPELILGGKIFKNVYSNYEINDKLKVYYSDLGILGFELPDGNSCFF